MAPTPHENDILPYSTIVENNDYKNKHWYDEGIRNSDGSIKLRNPNVENQEQDILYHLALGSGSHDLEEMFGDVRFVCMGGTPKRMESFAHYIMKQIDYKLPSGTQLLDISRMSYRYSMYKVGPVLCLSHGMGIPSVGILLHEIIKLMYHAKCKDPIFFRLGTCGGIGIEGGNLAISESAVDGMMNPYLELPVLGKMKRRPATLDKELGEELKTLSEPNDPFKIHIGKTMCTYDFYEGQGRLDGAFCEFKEEEKIDFLKEINQNGVINMEMESLCFAALCNEAGIRSACICVTLLNRLNGDQVSTPKETLSKWQEYPQMLVARYIRKELGLHNPPKKHHQVVKDSRKLGMVRQESASVE